MSIGSWLKRFRAREDERAIEHAQERQLETHEERHATEDLSGLEADERAARTFREPNIEDAERFADDT
ncbi:MAG TPA: hypothetical protein VNB50_02090 [Gaiellaceae bacterium]|jgi:hypothetical protein|nr:hypothetical protein [Gaiellaceae bacterium]